MNINKKNRSLSGNYDHEQYDPFNHIIKSYHTPACVSICACVDGGT